MSHVSGWIPVLLKETTLKFWPLSSHVPHFFVFSVELPGWKSRGIDEGRRKKHGFNQHGDKDAHLCPSRERGVLCVAVVNLSNRLISLTHLAYLK